MLTTPLLTHHMQDLLGPSSPVLNPTVRSEMRISRVTGSSAHLVIRKCPTSSSEARSCDLCP